MRPALIGDEVGVDLAQQLSALEAVGWTGLELRRVGGRWIADADVDDVARIGDELRGAGIEVPAVCSRIGGWAAGRTFEHDVAELRALVGRTRLLGTDRVRVMSFGDIADDRFDVVLARFRELVTIAEGEGLVLLHENCTGWAGGRHPERVVELLRALDRPALRVLLDVGNGLAYGYRALDLYDRVRPYVDHVHIKDGHRTGHDVAWTLPGEGEAEVPEVLAALVADGYRGWLSCEPHLFAVVHRGELVADAAAALAAFPAYAEALERMVEVSGV